MGLPANMDYGMYLNIGFWVILGLGLLVGFAKGFKKSLFTFITTLIFYLAFFLTIDWVVNWLWTLSVPQLGGWVGGFLPGLSGITKLSQAVPILLDEYGASFLGSMATNEQLLALADGIGVFALKIVYTLLYFTVINLIYRLLCAILRAIFSPHSKADDKYASKNRLLGGLFGFAGGVMAVFVTLIMLGGFMSVAESLVALVPADSSSDVVLTMPRQDLQDLDYSIIPVADSASGFELPPEVRDAVDELTTLVEAYDSNLFVTLASEVTMNDSNEETIPLNLYLFDEVLSFNYVSNALDPDSPVVQVSLRKELSVFAELGGLVLNSGISGTEDLLDITGEQIESLFDKLSESALVTSLLPLGIEYGAQMIQQDRPDFDIPIPREQLYAMDWSAELQNLGVITATLVGIAQSSGILDVVMDPENADFTGIVLSGGDIRNLFADLADSQLITLVALVAVEPALEMMGDQTIQLILTLPEDLDWSAELTAIGDVLGAILDTGLTIGDFNDAVENQNYGPIIQALANIDFTVLTESRIIKQALINILSGQAQIAGLEFLVVPDGIDWDTELENILNAANVLMDVAAGIDFSSVFGENPDMTQLLGVIGDLTEEDIDTLFQSTVLVATLSNLLLTTEIPGFELIVPDDILIVDGEIRYIQKEEFIALALSAKTVVGELACDEGDEGCSIVDINKATTLSEESVDTLLASRIIGATVGHLLFTMATGEGDQAVLVIPDEVKDLTVEMDGVGVDCVSTVEIKRLFGAIRVLDIDVNNFSFDASILNNLSLADDPGTPEDESKELDQDKLDDLFASVILRATITNYLTSMNLGGSITLVIPDSAMEAEKDYLSVEELTNALKAMKLVITFNECDLEADPDCQAIDFDIATVLNLDDEEIDVLLGSEILNATIGHYLITLDAEQDVLTVPASVIDQVQAGGVGTDVVVETELRAIFKAIRVLGLTDFESVDIDASIIDEIATDDDPSTPDVDESQEIVDLCGSVIIRATITNLLETMDLGSTATILVPDSAMEAGQDYLSSGELEAVVRAMKLVITFEGEEVNFDIASVLNLSDSEVDTLLGSDILTATIGHYLISLDLDQDVLTVPATVIVSTDVDGVPTDIVTQAEIRALFKAVGALGIDDFETVDLDASIISDIGTEDDPLTPDVDESQEIVDLCGSVILRATITDLLDSMDLGSTATILVPDSAMDVGQSYLSATELQNLVKAMKLVITTNDCDLDPDPSCESVSFDIASVLNLSDPEVETLLASDILTATIGHYLISLDLDQDVLTVPATVIVSTDVDGVSTDIVQKTEIRALFKAVRALGISDFESVDLDASIISDIGTEDDPLTPDIDESQEIVDLSASVILRATITHLLDSMDLGTTATILIPDSALDPGEDYLSATELQNAVKAMKLVITTNDCDLDPDPSCESVSFDIASVLNLSDSEIDVLLGSDILSATIGNYLVKLDTEQDVLTVPSTVIVSTDVDGVPTDIVQETEIRALFKAVRALGISDFESVDLDASILSDIGTEDDPATLEVDESLEVVDVSGSVIIRATLTHLLDSMDLGSTATILVPDPAMDPGQDYLSADELENMVRAMKLVILTRDCDLDPDPDCQEVDFDIDVVLSLSESQIDTLLDSVVVSATIGKYMIDMTDTLTIPTTAVEHLTVDGSDTPVVSAAEIHRVLSGVAVLGFDSFDGFTFDAGILQNLSLADDPETPEDESADIDETKLDTLFASVIIRATMSKMMLDLTGPDAFVVIPDFELDEIALAAGDPVLETVGGVQCITQTELGDVLRAMFYMDIQDLNAIDDEIDLAKIIANIDVILRSSILQASITRQLIDTEAAAPGSFIIPDCNEDGIRILFDISGSSYLTIAELSAVFHALDVLGFNDITDFSGSVDLANVGEGDNAHVLVSSSIIQATVSDQVNGLADAPDPSVVVPDFAVDGATAVRKTVNEGLADEVRYIAKDELEHLLLGLDVLGITQNVSTFGGDIDLTPLYDNDADQTVLLASAILHATISDQILGLGAALTVPDRDAGDTMDLRIPVGTVTYLDEGEIKHLINAIGVLFPDGVDLDAFSGTFDLASLYDNEADQDKLLLSASIHATISGQILGLGEALLVPATDVTSTTTIRFDVSGTTFVQGDEIKHLINAIGVLFPEGVDLDAFSGTFDLASLYDNEADQDKLLLSASIHATISDQVLGLGVALTVPDRNAQDSMDIRISAGGTTFVQGDEIKHLINAIGVLFPGGVDLDAFSGTFDLASLYDNGADQDKLLLSASIHATISGQILGLGAALTVPTTDVTSTTTIRFDVSGTTFVQGDEIKHLIDAIGVLFPGGVNLDEFSGTFDLASLYDNEADQDKLLLSASIHATISDQVLGLGAALTVPDRNAQDSIDIRISAGGVTFVQGDEIKHLINAIGVLFPGGVNLDEFSGTFNLAALYDNEADQDKLLLSASIHATISGQVLGLGDALLVPSTDVTGMTTIRFDVSGTTFVEGEEVKNLINAIGVLFPGGVNLDEFSGTFNLASLYDNEADQDKLLLSASIHATISDQIVGLADAGTVLLPETGYDESLDLQISAGGVTFVPGVEIKALINSLGVLFPGGINLDAFTGAINLGSLYDNAENQTKLLASSIIHATISDQILGLSAALVVPETDVDGVLDVQHPVDGTIYLLDSEIKNLINGLKLIGFGDSDISTYGGAISLSLLIEGPGLTQAEATANQNKLLLSAILQATIADTLFDLPDDVLIVPAVDENLADIIKARDVDFIVNAEIRALIDGFGKMGFTDLDSFGASIDSEDFFAQRDALLLSASMQATISDKMLYGTGGTLIVPDDYRVDATNCILIYVDEINQIMDVLEALDLKDFSTMNFAPGTIFAMEPADLLASGSMRATIADTLLADASDETAADGFAGLIVPLQARITISVDGAGATSIEDGELLALVTSLRMLGVTDFANDFDVTAIMGMDEAELNEFLESDSIHLTLHKMFKGNPNITIPDICTFTMYSGEAHEIASVTTTGELVDFILAVQILGGGTADFTDIVIDDTTAGTIVTMNQADREVVLASYIVRYQITPTFNNLVAAKNADYISNLHPEYCFNLDAEDYEVGYVGTLITYADSLDIVGFLNGDTGIID